MNRSLYKSVLKVSDFDEDRTPVKEVVQTILNKKLGNVTDIGVITEEILAKK